MLKGKELPFKDNHFDLVIATEVFEHIPHFRETKKEIERVLKDEGFIILSTPNYFNLTGIIKKVKDRKNPRPMWGPWGGHQGGLERFTTWFSDERLLSGFKIIKRSGADYYKAWFNENPFVPFRIRKYILLWPGKLPFLKYLGINYYLLGQKK